jgi:hypothetical protein
VPLSLAAFTRALRLLGTKDLLVFRDYAIYLDDSGTDPNQEVVVVAGYISTAREWKKLSAAWRNVLKRYGVPYFHMTEFMSRRGSKLFPKQAWPDERKNELITELVGIVGRGAMCQIGHAIPKHDWNAVVDARVKQHIGGPFAVCLNVCLRHALQWLPADLAPEERVGVVFDQGTQADTRHLLWAYGLEQRIRQEHGDHRLGPLQFDDKRSCPPLQAADIPALLHYQYVRDKDYAAGRVRQVYERLAQRFGQKNVRMSYMSEASLRDYVAHTEGILKKFGL